MGRSLVPTFIDAVEAPALRTTEPAIDATTCCQRWLLDLAASRLNRGDLFCGDPFGDLGVVLIAVLDEAIPAGWLVVTGNEPSRTPSIIRPDVHVSRQLKVIQRCRS